MAANLTKFVNEIQSIGGNPVLLTPLSRRGFGDDGKVADALAPWGAGKSAGNMLSIDFAHPMLNLLPTQSRSRRCESKQQPPSPPTRILDPLPGVYRPRRLSATKPSSCGSHPLELGRTRTLRPDGSGPYEAVCALRREVRRQ